MNKTAYIHIQITQTHNLTNNATVLDKLHDDEHEHNATPRHGIELCFAMQYNTIFTSVVFYK